MCTLHWRSELACQRPNKARTACLKFLQPEFPPYWHGAHQRRSAPSKIACLNDYPHLSVASRCIDFQFANTIHQGVTLGQCLLSSGGQRCQARLPINQQMQASRKAPLHEPPLFAKAPRTDVFFSTPDSTSAHSPEITQRNLFIVRRSHKLQLQAKRHPSRCSGPANPHVWQSFARYPIPLDVVHAQEKYLLACPRNPNQLPRRQRPVESAQ